MRQTRDAVFLFCYKSEKEMEVLSDMTEGLRNFAAQYNYAINDPELIRRYRFYEDGKRDEATGILCHNTFVAKLLSAD